MPSTDTAQKQPQSWKAGSPLATAQEDRECRRPHQQAMHCAHQARSHRRPQQGALGRRRMGKNGNTSQRGNKGSPPRQWFPWAQTLSSLHMHRVQVHSLRRLHLFLFNEQSSFDAPTSWLSLQNKPGMYNWPLPPLFGAVPREPERLCPGLKSSADLPDKHSSRCEAVFLSLFQLTRMWDYICPDEAFSNATWLGHSFLIHPSREDTFLSLAQKLLRGELGVLILLLDASLSMYAVAYSTFSVLGISKQEAGE